MDDESDNSTYPGDDEGEPKELWLVSYADMMTLIACFFILMVAFANYDPVGFNIKTKTFSKYFRIKKYKSSVTKLDKIQEEIIKHPQIKKMTKVTIDDNQLVIRFSGTVLFDHGDWRLKKGVTSTVDALVDIIKTSKYEFRILIAGHTSELNVDRSGSFVSDWQLSAARAATIADRFELFGLDPKRIIPLGKGSTEPLGEERDGDGKVIKENVLANNRVEIKILTPIEKGAKRLKMGLGVLFKE